MLRRSTEFLPDITSSGPVPSCDGPRPCATAAAGTLRPPTPGRCDSRKNPPIERYARLGLVEMRWAAHIQTDEARSHGELDSIIQAFEHPPDERGLAEASAPRLHPRRHRASEHALEAAEHALSLAADVPDGGSRPDP